MAAAGLAALTAAPAGAAPTALAPPRTLAGPGLAGLALTGLSIARDGSGGLVFAAGGHVFASRLIGGTFQAPQALDQGLGATSSQPVIAAGNGGLLLVAFVNGGELYVDEAASSSVGWQTPQALYANASAPSISISNFGKAYLAFTAAEAGGHDVRAEYFAGGHWAPAPEALNQSPGDDAGTGAGAPAVISAGDGVGAVAWGEGGHVYARRVWGTSPSVLVQRLDPSSVDGTAETSADSPAISAGGDSSYIDVVYRATLAGGQTRVLLSRLIAESDAPPAAVDAVQNAGQDAGQPAIAMNEYGRGFATAAVGSSAGPMAAVATALGTNGAPGAIAALGAAAPGSEPYATPALAGIVSTLIAYQGAAADGTPQVLLSYAADGSTLGSPMVVSDPAGGPTQAASGLQAGGDNEGDAAVAWVQGAAGSPALETAQLYVPPGQAEPQAPFAYSRSATPTLSWAPAREEWGPVSYTPMLDGTALPSTTSTTVAAPGPLIDGPHTWQVLAANPAGQQSTGPQATVFVDTEPPALHVSVSGRPRAHRRLTLRIAAVDLPAPEPGARASGIAGVSVSWGDRTPTLTRARLTRLGHAYARAGLYRLTVRAADAAGNRTTVARYLRILP
jgi:hypothetical protein